MEENKTSIKLTQFAHGAGCGCKIAPQVLSEILEGNDDAGKYKQLLVGNSHNDDAAVYDLGNGQALIATTDFFMPIVDDAFNFGKIAAANAISDVYAMGGTPTLALAILGWPVNKLEPALARKVIEGARTICEQAGIPLAGGHSIDTLEPMFGLSVNGLVKLEQLKKNNSAREGDLIFITKRLGTGILATAQKRGVLKPEDEQELIEQLSTLNTIGQKLAGIEGVTAMTDVTGFGILGHLIEMAGGSGLSAELYFDKLPKFKNLNFYISQNTLPDATFRNWNAYQAKVQIENTVNATEAFMVLPDPQTNGGILFTVNPEASDAAIAILKENHLGDFIVPIGKMTKKGEKTILVV